LKNKLSNFPKDEIGLINFDKNLITKEIDYFELLFDDNIFSIIVNESNRYFEEKYLKKDKTYARSTWQYQFLKKKISKNDMKDFLAILLCFSVCELPQKRMYWSDNPILKQSYVTSIMSRYRFEMIAAALHLKEDIVEMGNNLTKIIPFMELLSKNYRKYYRIDQEICIDESMIEFKGR